MAHEQGNSQETVGQQFIDYVTTHSDIMAPEQRLDPDQVRESYWATNIELPLLYDTITEVSFLERELTLERGTVVRGSAEDYEAVTKPTYDIGIHLRSGLNAYYTYRPNNQEIPYMYMGTEGDSELIQEGDIAKLMTELKGYEATGLMTKIEPQADGSR